MRRIEDREEAKQRKLESNRKAVAKYQGQYKRINCRFEPELYNQIINTGMSTNSFIIEAVKEKLDRMRGSYNNNYN
jgi:ribosomal protein L18